MNTDTCKQVHWVHTRKMSSLPRPAAPCAHPHSLDSSWREVHSDEEVGGGRVKGPGCSQQGLVWGKDKRGCAGLGPSSGMWQVGLLVPWQGPRGQAAQPMPTPGLAPSSAHTLSRGLGNTSSEIPTIPSSLSDPAHLLSERQLHSRALRRGRASVVQKLLRSAQSPQNLHPLGRREREELLELPMGSELPAAPLLLTLQDVARPPGLLWRASTNTLIKPPERTGTSLGNKAAFVA